MANRGFGLFLVISVAMTCVACPETPEAASRFLSGFSARDVIEKSYGSPEGAGEIRVTGGDSSTLLGGRRIHHRGDRADLNISQNEEPLFLKRIKEQIEQQLSAAGCRVVDSGSGEGIYSIGYTDGKARGWIDIWGLRGSGDSYSIVITITEN